MAIILDETNSVLIQGITGKTGRMLAKKMILEGTPLVAGVSPSHGGEVFAGVPVFESVQESVARSGANTSMIIIPSAQVKEAALEAIESGIRTIVIYTEGVPLHDASWLITYARMKGVTIIGPNTAGVFSAGKCNVSEIENFFVSEGRIGVLSRSGTLCYEICMALSDLGLGQSTVCDIGGDPLVGLSFVDGLEMFQEDPDTDAIILLGEAGGIEEIEASYVIPKMKKTVFAFVNGHSLPQNRKFGHAGAIIMSNMESADYKTQCLKEAGAISEPTFSQLLDSISKWKSK
jgi:succinyl-CoA synthetase alpha subunit